MPLRPHTSGRGAAPSIHPGSGDEKDLTPEQRELSRLRRGI